MTRNLTSHPHQLPPLLSIEECPDSSRSRAAPVSVNTVNCDGSSALVLATQYGDWSAAKLLLQYGADVNFTGRKKTTPLMGAAGATVFFSDFSHYRGGRDLRDPILASLPAFREEKLQVVSQLLHHGASTDCRTVDGETALSLAAGLGDTETVEMLIDHGARIMMDDGMPDRGLWRWYVTFYSLRNHVVLRGIRCERLIAFRLKMRSKARRSSARDDREYHGGSALDLRDGGTTWEWWQPGEDGIAQRVRFLFW